VSNYQADSAHWGVAAVVADLAEQRYDSAAVALQEMTRRFLDSCKVDFFLIGIN
jgi:hypothetical protein